MASVDYELETLNYAFDERASQLFAQPELFDQHIIQGHFSCKYTALLYELVSRYYYAGELSWLLPINELREHLGMGEGKLVNFNDLQRFALTPAITEINNHARFSISYQTEVKGRKVIALKFVLQPKAYAFEHVYPDQVAVINDELRSKLQANRELAQLYKYIVTAPTSEREKLFYNLQQLSNATKCPWLTEQVDCPELWVESLLVSSGLAPRAD
jgi:plasmid replication initiation protein